LATIFITQLLLNNFLELATPWFKNRQRRLADEGRSGVDLLKRDHGESKARTPAEEEYELEEYGSTFSDFDEIVIQYGYTTLFTVAFPLTSLLALFNNFIETRLDSYKLLHLCRRPHPRGADSIGTWYYILDILSVMAVITNIAVLMFVMGTGDYLSGDDLPIKFFLFFCFEHVVLLIKFVIATIVPDEPFAITEHLERQKHIVDVIIRDAEEDDDVSFEIEEKDPEVHLADPTQLPLGVEEPQVGRHRANPVAEYTTELGLFSRRSTFM